MFDGPPDQVQEPIGYYRLRKTATGYAAVECDGFGRIIATGRDRWTAAHRAAAKGYEERPA
jgi:hypothetical protein